MAPLPNFLIIGAQKAGTTSLYHYLNQHPEIFLSEIKEPRFFALRNDPLNYNGPDDPAAYCPHKDLKRYKALFEGTEHVKARGEASTLYHYSEQAPKNIKELVPEMKLIMVFRNPAERAFSNYKYAYQNQKDPENKFEIGLDKESERIKQRWGPLWHYKRKGLYASQMKRYLNYFDRSQFKFFLFQDLKKAPQQVCKDIFRFLEVDRSFSPKLDIQHNKSGVPRSKRLQKFLTSRNFVKDMFSFLPKKITHPITRFVKRINVSHDKKVLPQMKNKTYNELIDFYSGDIHDLQEIIDRDLTHWLVKKMV